MWRALISSKENEADSLVVLALLLGVLFGATFCFCTVFALIEGKPFDAQNWGTGAGLVLSGLLGGLGVGKGFRDRFTPQPQQGQ